MFSEAQRTVGGVTFSSAIRTVHTTGEELRPYLPILSAIWAMSDRRASDQSLAYPPWFWDEVTENQLDQLDRDGITVIGTMTKGMASDVIGLVRDHYDEERDRLTTAPSQTIGRYIERELAAQRLHKKTLYDGVLDELLPLYAYERNEV